MSKNYFFLPFQLFPLYIFLSKVRLSVQMSRSRASPMVLSIGHIWLTNFLQQRVNHQIGLHNNSKHTNTHKQEPSRVCVFLSLSHRIYSATNSLVLFLRTDFHAAPSKVVIQLFSFYNKFNQQCYMVSVVARFKITVVFHAAQHDPIFEKYFRANSVRSRRSHFGV